MASKFPESVFDLTRRDFRTMILILFKMQKTRQEIHETLQEHFPAVAPSLSTVERHTENLLMEISFLEMVLVQGDRVFPIMRKMWTKC